MTAVAHPAPRPARHKGSSVRRLDGDRYVRGEQEFVADVTPPGTLHMAVVRSRCAHARIRGVRADAAAALPGVALVLDGREAAEHVAPIPSYIDPTLFGGRAVEATCLATDRVLWAGQPVVIVVADTPETAREAADLVEVDEEPLAHVLELDEALAPDAPVLGPGWSDNVLIERRSAFGDFEGALASAHGAVTDELRIHRYGTAPIEPRACVAEWDDAAGALTVHATTQNPHPLRWVLSRTLGLDEQRIRVRVPRLGGSFGLKMPGHPEETLVALAARRLQRPVKWVETREESLLIGAREQWHRFTACYEADGTITGLRNSILANIGAVSAMPGWTMARLAAVTLPCGYRIQNCDVDYRCVVTNKGPWNAARGYGKEAANLVMERAVDLVARAVGLDPLEVRERNLVRSDEFPYRTALGLNLDSGDYHRALADAAALVQYPRQRERQAQLRGEGRQLGIGIAYEVTPEAAGIPGTMVGDHDTSTVRVDGSGQVTVLTGVTAPGGGNETGIAQVVADELGVAPEAIEVVQGDTDECPFGFGNYSGRGMLMGGASAASAARAVHDELLAAARPRLDGDVEQVALQGDALVVVGDERRRVPLAEVLDGRPVEATRTYHPGNVSHEPDEHGRRQPYPSYSNGAYVAVVEVDAETGLVTVLELAVVHDCGTIINEALVEGQVHGAVAMGLGGALSEELSFEPDGRLRADRFKTYLLPRATDMPRVHLGHVVCPTPFTLLGTKGAGEAGIGGTVAAIANAVDDAIAPLGARIGRLPLSAPNVLAALRGADATAGAPA